MFNIVVKWPQRPLPGAQNCVRVCPKEIPLTTAIAEIYRATTLHGLKKLFGT